MNLFYKNQNYLQGQLKIYIFGLILWAGSGFSLPVIAEEQTVDRAGSIAAEIKAIILSRQHPGLLLADFTNRAENVNRLYELVGYQLLWFGSDAALKNNQQAIALLQHSAENALSLQRYELEFLQENLATAQSADMLDPRHLAVFDTALSIEILRYMYDLHYGRVDPQGVHFKLGLRTKKADLPELLVESMNTGKLAKLNESLEPPIKQYQRLKQTLGIYRKLAANVDAQNFVLATPVTTGKSDKQMPKLRNFLTMLGDYKGVEKVANPLIFADQDSAAVKNFQQRHGLQPTGGINHETLAALNIPLTQRITQIELAMERLRWLPERSNGPGLLVNIPAFRLWALDSDGDVDETQLSMRVVVGEALKNQTPILMSEMQYLDFMPHWNIPQSIVKKEILQKLERNRNYLNAQNMEIVPNFDRHAPALAFDESLMDDLRSGSLKIRQRPGKRNALGRVKFIFPNSDNVYLHDTPAGALFKKLRRDFSHGCVRVEDPVALAEYVLQPQPKWNREAIKKAMVQHDEQRVSLPKTVPITIFYTTAFFDQPDRLTFYPDIYGHDSILQQALAKPVEVADSSLFLQEAAAEIPAEGNLLQ